MFRWRLALALLLFAVFAATAGVAVSTRIGSPDSRTRRLQGHLGAIPALRYSADGRRLLSGSWDQTVRLWDERTGKRVGTFTGALREINDVALSPDGAQAAAASEDESILRWDTRTGKRLDPVLILDHPAVHIAYSPDGQRIAGSGRNDGAVRLWNTKTGLLVGALTGHRGATVALAFSPDGRVLATADDMAVRLWRVADEELMSTIPVRCGHSVLFSPDGRRVVVAGAYTSPQLWDTASGRFLCRIREPEAHAVAFVPDGVRLLTAAGARIALWDVTTGKRLSVLVSPGLPGHFPDFLIRLCPWLRDWQQKPVGGLAVSPDGRSIAYSTENTISIRPLP